MQASLRNKLDELLERHEDIAHTLADPGIAADPERFRQLAREYAQLEELAGDYRCWRELGQEIASLEELAAGDEPDLAAIAEEELPACQQRLEDLEHQLRRHLIPKDRRDQANVYLEVRAGTGGDEAALFAGDLLRMYLHYAQARGWRADMISTSDGEHGGYKSVFALISGQGVYARLKFESGAHRVQRVPETESQGRIHTSACTVAVLPELDEVEAVAINPADLRVDTFRAAGAGGQHVNKTDSAVRLTHLPTGLVVECQQERSQHKNRAQAMALLQSKLLTSEQDKRAAEQAATRKRLVGSGDRSQRIRTYNFPQGRVTDHRINLTLYKLEAILGGALDEVIDALANEDQADQLANLGA